ncbi:CBS-HotDog domain-containing transcription factor SpxR [Streptococcus equinus]|uniref:DRTGG domain protein n=1 Tax=Streptococcus equinus ATCC 9812 TaxID=525379 RepID=E8JMF3_STREI|nr:CBS-HotDog domain-containing transcription factor SpxR [Streptococcus equinus]EFW89568.1 DRTGG domain protein [Streptococcus equinus ATCC 9812]SUN56578.1 DRTGG domain-containing protein [Streptococcus equinus]
MSKHQKILEYLENLAIGKRVSVRSISNHLNVSDGTAYRAIKEAENRGIVETRPRSGTVRIEKKATVRIERLTYSEIARISDSEVLAGKSGLTREFSKFSIGAMTQENISRYLVKGGLLIVGDRENIQLLALENHNAILVTGGFSVSEAVIRLADELGIPVMVTNYDTFTVATMINHALSNVRIKTDLTTVDQVYQVKAEYGFLREGDTIRDFNTLMKQTKNVRFPVVNNKNIVIGVVSMLDVVGQENNVDIKSIMSRNLIVAKPQASLANISQKMIFEDLNMLPVVADDLTLLGVITRRQAVENLQNLQHSSLYTYSEQMLSNLKHEDGVYQFVVEPAMIDHAGNFAQGVLTEFIKEISVRVLTKKHQKNIIIEQLMLYFLQAVQIDDRLVIQPRIITEKRRSSVIDFEILLDNQIVAKALVTTKIN